MALQHLSGTITMVNYTASIFEEAGSTLAPSQSAIIIAIVQLFGNYSASILVDRAGRKILFLVSAAGCGLGLLTLGLFMSFKEHLQDFKWIPLVSFAFLVYIASVGILALPNVILPEIMPNKVEYSI